MMKLAHDIIDILEYNNFEARIAGGAVRDTILGIEPKDIDIATNALPNQVVEIFRKFGYEVIETGLQHGTVTVIYDHIPFEITTLRVDKKTDGRHAVVEFTNDWMIDAMRRDFTINAMYMDRHGNIFDYFNGEEHLNRRLLKFVGNADKRIQEDYLRILRWFRFSAKYNLHVDSDDAKWIHHHRDGLKNISAERIFSEIEQFIKYAEIDEIQMMNELGISKVIFGDNLNFTLNIFDDWYMTLHSMGIGSEWFEKFKAPSYIIKKIKFMETFIPSELNYDTFVHGYDYIGDYSNLNDLNWNIPVDIPMFPVNGNKIVELGYKGQQIGTVMTNLKKIWAKNNFLMSEKELLEKIND